MMFTSDQAEPTRSQANPASDRIRTTVVGSAQLTLQPETMTGFTLYRVEADYVVPGEYAFGCGWICDTRLQAEALLAQLKDTRKDLCDLRIVPAHYGNPICD